MFSGRERLAGAKRLDLQAGKADGVEVVIQEGLGRDGDDGLDEGEHGVGVVADLLLGVRVHAQREEVEQVVQVDLPVPLGVDAQRQPDAGQLPGDALVQHRS